jgi:glycosyltransferase involved in cell wall biosynthesis
MMHILLPTSGRAELLSETLESLCAAPLPDDFQTTIVIENGPKSEAESIVSAYARRHPLRYIYTSPANKSRALNIVLRQIREGLVVFLDDDVHLEPETLRAYAKASDTYGPKHFFGGTVRPHYDSPPPSWIMEFLPRSAKGLTKDFFSKGLAGSAAISFLGMNWAAYAQDLHTAGLFEADFGPGSRFGATGQERTMLRKLIAHRFTPVFVAEAVVHHRVPSSTFTEPWVLRRSYKKGIEKGLSILRPWDPRSRRRHPFLRELYRDTRRLILTIVRPSARPRRLRILSRANTLLGFVRGIVVYKRGIR